jgi:hypothetical protein
MNIKIVMLALSILSSALYAMENPEKYEDDTPYDMLPDEALMIYGSPQNQDGKLFKQYLNMTGAEHKAFTHELRHNFKKIYDSKKQKNNSLKRTESRESSATTSILRKLFAACSII